jgi:hypothetical protein
MQALQALVEVTPLNIELAKQVIWWMAPPKHPSACLYRDKALLDADDLDDDIIEWLLEAREWLWCTTFNSKFMFSEAEDTQVTVLVCSAVI